MGRVKELVGVLAEAGLQLVELQDAGIGFVLTGSPTGGFSWYLAPESSEYEQADWIFHALRQGNAESISGAVEALGRAVCDLLPDSPYAMARAPRRRKASLRKAG